MFVVNNENTKPTLLVIASHKIAQAHQNRIKYFNEYLGKSYGETVFFIVTEDKPKVKKTREDLVEILEYAELNGISLIVPTVALYFKELVKEKEFEKLMGGIFKVPDRDYFDVIPLVNPSTLEISAIKKVYFDKALETLKNKLANASFEVKEKILITVDSLEHNGLYINEPEVRNFLMSILKKPELTCDIETTGIGWYNSDLLTLSFGYGKLSAGCIAIHSKYSSIENSAKVKMTIKNFLYAFKGKIIGHNFIGFDNPHIVHSLFRNRDFAVPHEPLINKYAIEDTLLLAYTNLNSTERPELGLKSLVFDKMGEYDSEIDQSDLLNTDLRKIADYNNLDCIATQIVWDRYKDTANSKIYRNMLKQGTALSAVKMTGVRVDTKNADKAVNQITKLLEVDIATLNNIGFVKRALKVIQETEFMKINEKLKNKKTFEQVKDRVSQEFNTNSPQQMQVLCFDIMKLPLVVKSKETGLPSTGKESFTEWLENPSISKDRIAVLKLLEDINKAKKARDTFIKKFNIVTVEVAPNDFRIFSRFNQTGTISGRLSSSGEEKGGVNLQNLPSNSKYGAVIKKLLIAPKGWIFGGIDYSALEDRLIAIASNDTNKLRIFKENIDGHSLNAHAYFEKEIISRGITIDLSSADSINSIAKLCKDLRQAGKSVTFGLNYGATKFKIASLLKISKDEAQDVIDSYWKLYEGVAKYNASVSANAIANEQIESQYSGLILRTPAVKSSNDFILAKELRVAGNFATQSGGCITVEALTDFFFYLVDNNLYEHIKICNTIHDAIYVYCKPEYLSILNDVLPRFMTKDFMENQPIKLEAQFDFGRNLKQIVTVENGESNDSILKKVRRIRLGDTKKRTFAGLKNIYSNSL